MSLFPEAKTARRLFADAYETRQFLARDDDPVDAIPFLEFYLAERFHQYQFDVVENLTNLAGIRVEGITVFSPVLQIAIDQAVYDAARKNQDGPSRFSIFHEGGHLIHHRNDKRAREITQLNRGMANTGTSFREHPELETEANFWAGAILIPHTAIERTSKAKDLALRYRTSTEVAEKAIKIARVMVPGKWRLP